MDVETVARVLDRIGGGGKARLRVRADRVRQPATRRALNAVTLALVLALAVDITALVVAVAGWEVGARLDVIAWLRLLMISLLTASLFYFVWRLRRGWWWAYSRLRLFTVVFPAIAIGSCLVPGLYPAWMVVEQLLLAALLAAVAVLLFSHSVRVAFEAPQPMSQPDAPDAPDA